MDVSPVRPRIDGSTLRLIIGLGVDISNISNNCRRLSGNGRLIRDLGNQGTKATSGIPLTSWQEWIVALGICFILWICYANSFHASWHYDDSGNILNNDDVHMSQWSLHQVHRALTAGHDFQTISRPLAYLSFAINHRLGGLDPTGYHIVNFVIHCIASVFLYLLIRDTLCLPVLKGRYEKQARWIAIIAAVLWATHPIQVSAVTYIVQRMASMAGMFYVASMYLYLKARTSHKVQRRVVFFTLSAISAIFALLTKENSLLLFYGVLLYDLILLQGIDRQSLRRSIILAVVLSAGVLLIGMLYTDITTFFKPYEIRPFDRLERLLTQPRVLFFYLTLIAVPMTSRMSILHDIEISRSLLMPWTTLAAVLALVGCVLFLFALARRNPVVSFCGLFFFLNHLVEGSVLNLELIYEHRNYVPAMFIFVPVAIAGVRSAQYFVYRRPIQWSIWATIVLVMFSQGFATHQYNGIFESELSLWLHASRRSPRLSLSHNNLGNIYWNMGLRSLAYQQYQIAQELDRFNNLRQKGHLLYNIGLYTAYEKNEYKAARDYFVRAVEIYNGSPKVWYELARANSILKRYGEAQANLDIALSHWPDRSDLHYLQSYLHAKNGRCAQALVAAEESLNQDPDRLLPLMVIAGSHTCMGDTQQAIDIWKRFLEEEDKSLVGILSLIDLYISEDEMDNAQPYFERLLQMADGREPGHLLDLVNEETELIAYIPDKTRLIRAFQNWRR